MGNLITLLKSPNVKVAILLVFILFFPLFGGSLINMSWTFRIGIAVFLVLILIIVLLFRKMKQIQKAGKIEKSISSQANADIQSLSPEKRAEIDQFRKQLEAAIASLKNSKIGKGKTGKAALYALPWYMIIGPSAAGKTTAIQNSGLEFPFGKEGFRGVGGTRNCDWFFSTKGIFLDTAGRYVTQSEDRIEWGAFLDVLKKNRRKKPINGVITALNIDEIINCNKDQLYEHARNIRQRIDELIHDLGVNFPVYFMFTKCDLIQGFVEYYSDFSETERSQIWGATFPFQAGMEEDAKNRFEKEFNILADKLFEIRTTRLSSPLKREQRRKVFLFPFQFKSLQQKLSYLITEAFQYNPYQDNPVFRGFYFTSGTQEGIPLDLAIREIAKQFNLPSGEGFDEDETGIVERKHYFIKDLLNDIVIGDQNYNLGLTAGFSKKQSLWRLGVASASIVLMLLFCLFTYIGFNGSKDSLKNIETSANTFAEINWNGDLLTNFNKSENLRSLINDIENGDAVKSFVSFGLDRTDKTKDLLEDLYLDKTDKFFNQNIYNQIESLLNNYANGQDYSNEEIYNYLKSYLLLGSDRARIDSSEQRFLFSMFTNILESKYIRPNLLSSSREKDSLKNLFAGFASSVVYKLKNSNAYPVKSDNLLISLVRSRIQYQPGAENLYARLKQNGTMQFTNDLILEQIIGGRFSNFIKSDFKIPYIFTADGWKNYVQGAIIHESINPNTEDWVIGESKMRSSFENLDSETIRKELILMYLNDYKQNWLGLLQSVRYSGFETVPIAANNLKLLSDPVGSPLVLLLKSFASQLQVVVDILNPPSDSVQIKPASFIQGGSGNPNLIEIERYRKLVLAPDGATAQDLNAIIAQYGLLSGILESIKEGHDLTKDYAVKVLSQRAVEFPTALVGIKGALYNTPSLKNLFTEPIRLTWHAILNDASQYLNSQWKAKVFDVFNKSMANSFPFKKSVVDVPIQDFKDFFEPQNGILWTFVKDELGAFINIERWKINQWEGEGLNISNELITSLKKAKDISSTLFKNGELSVTFRLKPKLPESKTVGNQKPIVQQVYLSIDNFDNYYKMGAPFWSDYTWPGSRGVPGARMNISLHSYGTSETKTYDGEWALFRLCEEASIASGETPSQYIFNWFFQKENYYDVNVSYLINAGSSKNPFAANFFKSFHLPDRIN